MAGESKAAGPSWDDVDRFPRLETPMERLDPAVHPFKLPAGNRQAFRPLTIADHLRLAEAPKKQNGPRPYILDRPAATYDHRDTGDPRKVVALQHYRSGDTLRLPGADVRISPTGRPIVDLQPEYDDGRSAARRGPVLVPAGPDGVSVDANMKEAGRHPPWWLMEKVPNGQPWDYKQRARQYEAFGNFNFGAVGRSARLPDGVLLKGAGWAQGQAHANGPDFGSPYLGTGSYGDDPIDQFWIVQGSRYHDAKRRR